MIWNCDDGSGIFGRLCQRVDFDQGKTNGGHQRPGHHADQSKDLNATQDGEEEQKGVDVCF